METINKMYFTHKFYNTIRNFAEKDFYGFVGYLFFGIFFIHSLIFYVECIAYQDYAWEATYFLNKRGFNLVYFRWGSLPWRIFLIVGPYIGLSLKAILILTSVWFVFLKFAVWYVCHYCFKNVFAGLLVIASILLIGSKGYYAHGWQIHNAILYFCLLYATLMDKDKKVISSNIIRVFLIITLIVLIKGTYAVVVLLCPLIILFTVDSIKNKILFLVSFGIFGIASIIFFNPPYEVNILNSIVYTLRTKGLSEYSGIVVHLVKDIISLAYLIPLLFFGITIYILVKMKQFLNLFLFFCFSGTMLIIVLSKLATYKSGYPLSDNVEFYLQGAFFNIWMLVIPISFFWIHKYYPHSLQSDLIKIIFVFTTIFYTSRIFSEGIKHLEYNRYINRLAEYLNKTFPENIFIIDEHYIPYRFSKINMNIEYETLIKSNLHIGESIILFITPHTKPYQIEGKHPVFINSISPFEITREINFDPTLDLSVMKNTRENQELKHYKKFNPAMYFNNFNNTYFKFKSFEYKVLDKDYMNEFNKKYGFAISDYYY